MQKQGHSFHVVSELPWMDSTCFFEGADEMLLGTHAQAARVWCDWLVVPGGAFCQY